MNSTTDAKPKGRRVSAEEFVIAWHASSSLGEVARKLGLERSEVVSRAAYYRGRGVRLRRIAKESGVTPRRPGSSRVPPPREQETESRRE